MTVGTTEDRMQCLISRFTVSGLGQVWDNQSYREVIPSVPFPLSTGEWEVLFNNWRSSLIKRVNITVCNTMAGCSSQRRAWTHLFLYAWLWCVPGSAQDIFRPFCRCSWTSEQLGALSSTETWQGCLLFPCHGRTKCGQKKFPLCT